MLSSAPSPVTCSWLPTMAAVTAADAIRGAISTAAATSGHDQRKRAFIRVIERSPSRCCRAGGPGHGDAASASARPRATLGASVKNANEIRALTVLLPARTLPREKALTRDESGPARRRRRVVLTLRATRPMMLRQHAVRAHRRRLHRRRRRSPRAAPRSRRRHHRHPRQRLARGGSRLVVARGVRGGAPRRRRDRRTRRSRTPWSVRPRRGRSRSSPACSSASAPATAAAARAGTASAASDACRADRSSAARRSWPSR